MVLPIVLIALGGALLVANVAPEALHGAVLLLGLGAAFLLARLATSTYGLAVPACLLLALGAFAALDASRQLQARGGWFFLCLGLGFLAIYPLGGRRHALWPLAPAALLLVVAALFFGVSVAAALARWAWLVNGWPLLLVALGVWLMVHDRLPSAAQRPLAALAVLSLVGYALLVAAALVGASPR